MVHDNDYQKGTKNLKNSSISKYLENIWFFIC